MDPTQTLADIFQALYDGRKDDAYDALERLREWIEKGGYADPMVKQAMGKVEL